eukprot:5473743-Prymnesium_polylepis.1
MRARPVEHQHRARRQPLPRLLRRRALLPVLLRPAVELAGRVVARLRERAPRRRVGVHGIAGAPHA